MKTARKACLLGMLFSVGIVGIPHRVAADEVLINPDWEIHITDHGYSDVLFYNAGPFPFVFLHEMISGEWAGAIAYDGLFPIGAPALPDSLDKPPFAFLKWHPVERAGITQW